ncbi:hypothetical protein IFM89_007830 [Coptis chinensis]|uniref:Uncharacterized protein n=1 Tax=Coptis chinensis TaxID=261450 RepID=A0A835I1D7_9MAGN|nr:hypothetical protein IFM89_007830 [Coptis chinensis]
MFARLKKPRKQVRPRPSHKEMIILEPRRSSHIAELPTPKDNKERLGLNYQLVYTKKSHPKSNYRERRSSRISKLPTPIYKEDPNVIEESPMREYSEESRVNHVIETAEDSRVNPMMERAEDLKSKLENGFPSFVKPMTQSYLKGGTWLVSTVSCLISEVA